VRSSSILGVVVGLLAFAVGLVGYVLLGWRFGGESSDFATALGLLAVVVAVVVTVRDRL
jgi:multidrug transporter EmrE-like cation transporter